MQFVLLRSSNTLDQVFLSQFLRRSYPEGRIIIDGADLLFLRSQSALLRGVMTLSTYPLLPEQQSWTRALWGKPDASYRIFGQDSSEALYIAARELLPPSGAQSRVPIHDYAPPRWAPIPPWVDELTKEDSKRPSTWLTVIGHRRFWPVALLNSFTLKPESKPSTNNAFQEDTFPHSLLTPAGQDELKHGSPPMDEEPGRHGGHLRFPLEMKALLATCLLIAMWHLLCCWYGSLNGAFRVFALFAPTQRPQHRMLVFLGCFVIGLFGIVLGSWPALLSGRN